MDTTTGGVGTGREAVDKALARAVAQSARQGQTPPPWGGLRAPVSRAQPASIRRVESPESAAGSEDEPMVELVPGLRVVGPGRRERSYLDRIESLKGGLRTKQDALETAALLERGTSRLVDRLESESFRDRERLQEMQAQTNRLLVTLGAMQRENERLTQTLEDVRLLEAGKGEDKEAHRPGPLRRLLRRFH